jgi:hypothetical protein
MDIIFYVHKSVELLFQILGLVEVWTRRSMELSSDAYYRLVQLLHGTAQNESVTKQYIF